MQSVVSDLTYAFRQIRRDISTAAVCVVVLGVGIGSATAVFTVVLEAILEPLPYVNAEQLVYVHNEFPRAQLARTGESAPDFADLTTHREIFSCTAAYFLNDFAMTGTVYAQHVDAVNVSATLFPNARGERQALHHCGGRWQRNQRIRRSDGRRHFARSLRVSVSSVVDSNGACGAHQCAACGT
jgi:hypothetical protein